MLALLGIKSPNDLQENIQKELSIPTETASALTKDISQMIFEPVREELERELDHPQAKEGEVSDLDQVQTELLAEAKHDGATIPELLPKVDFSKVVLPVQSVAPTTPPPTKSDEKAVRAAAPTSAAEPSATRKAIANDPYREQL